MCLHDQPPSCGNGLFGAEAFDSRTLAVRREHQIKRWTRAKKEALIARDPALLKRL
jgi:predicted GIY-YIG superfamily endonuclease